MSKDLRIEIIYFDQPSNISLEFGLHGNYPLRLLTGHTDSYSEFLKYLKRAVSRSSIIVTVGDFFGKLPIVVAKATNKPYVEADLAHLGVRNKKNIMMPNGSIPLITSRGLLGGFILESGTQSIIMLSEEPESLLELLQSLVVPYIYDHYKTFGGATSLPSAVAMPLPVIVDLPKDDNILKENYDVETTTQDECDEAVVQKTTETDLKNDLVSDNDSSTNEEEICIETEMPLKGVETKIIEDNIQEAEESFNKEEDNCVNKTDIANISENYEDQLLEKDLKNDTKDSIIIVNKTQFVSNEENDMHFSKPTNGRKFRVILIVILSLLSAVTILVVLWYNGIFGDIFKSQAVSSYNLTSNEGKTSSIPVEKPEIYVIGTHEIDFVAKDGSYTYEQRSPDSYTAPTNSSTTTSVISEEMGSNISSQESVTTPEMIKAWDLNLTVTNADKKIRGSAKEIVQRVVEAEMGSSYPIEALKAQAVATYSWLISNGAHENKCPNVPMKIPGANSEVAVNAVSGKMIMIKGSVANTYYFERSAGKTANSGDYFATPLSYLVSVDATADVGLENTTTYTTVEISKLLKSKLDIDLSGVDPSLWFKGKYDKNNLYCTELSIKYGDEYVTKSGGYVRSELFSAENVGARLLKSNAFTFTYDATNNSFTFLTKGSGHGIGMSQNMAKSLAESGKTYDQILLHFYIGTVIE